MRRFARGLLRPHWNAIDLSCIAILLWGGRDGYGWWFFPVVMIVITLVNVLLRALADDA